MALQDFIRQAFETNWEWTERYIDGLSQEEIEYRPSDQCHSIGFILWHYGRALDMWVQTRAKGGTQLYEDGWAERLGMTPEPTDVGVWLRPGGVEQLALPRQGTAGGVRQRRPQQPAGVPGQPGRRCPAKYHYDHPHGRYHKPGPACSPSCCGK